MAYDSFNYTVGTSISTLNGGAGFSSAWGISQSTSGGNGTVLVSTSGITSTPSHPTVGNTSGGGIYATRSLDRISSGTVYFSFLVDNVNDGERFIAFSLMDGGAEKMYIGQASGGNVWGFFNSGALSTSPSRNGVSGMTQLVLKVEFDQSGTNDRATLFVNPDLNGSEPTTGIYSNTGDYFSNGINGIRLGSGYLNSNDHSTAIASFDEVRITTDWASISQAPEPGRGLLILGSLAACLLRRRRTNERFIPPGSAPA